MRPVLPETQSSRVWWTIARIVRTPRSSGPTRRAQVPRYSISLDALERLPSLSLSRWMWNGLRLPSGRQRGTRKQVGGAPGRVSASVSSASLIGAE